MSVHSATLSRSASTSSKMKEKLLSIKEREDLKGQLVSKFILKYGKPYRQNAIASEVDKALDQGKLTEANLRALDDRIKERMDKATTVGAKSSPSLMSAISVSSAASRVSAEYKPPKTAGGMSYMSGATNLSALSSEQVQEQRTLKSTERPPAVPIPKNIDEWAAINEYTSLMHQEKERLKKEKRREQQIVLRKELERPMEEKQKMMKTEQEELKKYMDSQTKYLSAYDERELQRLRDQKALMMYEKKGRDRQMKELKRLRRLQTKEDKDMEAMIVKKIQDEYAAEQRQMQYRRMEEHNVAHGMMLESIENKEKQMEQERKRRQDEINMQQQYGIILDRQEQQRVEDIRRREEKQAKVFTTMVETVVKEKQKRSNYEDETLAQFYGEQEKYLSEQEMLKKERARQRKLEVRASLEEQIKERARRKEEERRHYNEQATMWKKDAEGTFHTEFDQRNAEDAARRAQLHREYARQLKEQVDFKHDRAKGSMNEIERAYNLPLMEEIVRQNEQLKLKTMSQASN